SLAEATDVTTRSNILWHIEGNRVQELLRAKFFLLDVSVDRGELRVVGKNRNDLLRVEVSGAVFLDESGDEHVVVVGVQRHAEARSVERTANCMYLHLPRSVLVEIRRYVLPIGCFGRKSIC